MTTAAADLVDEGERAGRIGAPRSRQARRRRVALLEQLVLLGALAAGAFVIVRNTLVNLQARGLAAGLDFLWQEAGSNVAFSLIVEDASSSYGRGFLAGLLTFLLSAHVCFLAGTPLRF